MIFKKWFTKEVKKQRIDLPRRFKKKKRNIHQIKKKKKEKWKKKKKRF